MHGLYVLTALLFILALGTRVLVSLADRTSTRAGGRP
jgi:hypothetical protein